MLVEFSKQLTKELRLKSIALLVKARIDQEKGRAPKASPRRAGKREAQGLKSVSIGEINRRLMSAKTQVKNSIHHSEAVEPFHSNFVFSKPRPFTASHQRLAQQRHRTASDADPVARPPPQRVVLEQKVAEINQEQRRRTKMLDRRSENEKLRQAKLAAELAHAPAAAGPATAAGPAKAAISQLETLRSGALVCVTDPPRALSLRGRGACSR